MIGYLYDIAYHGVPENYCFEIYSTPTTRVSWSRWWNTVDEALAAPQIPTPGPINSSCIQRLREFNNIHSADGLRLRLHSTYTSISHPELLV